MAWNKLAWEDFKHGDLLDLSKAIKMQPAMEDQTMLNLQLNVETLTKCLEVEATETKASVDLVEDLVGTAVEVMALEDLEDVEALTTAEVLEVVVVGSAEVSTMAIVEDFEVASEVVVSGAATKGIEYEACKYLTFE